MWDTFRDYLSGFDYITVHTVIVQRPTEGNPAKKSLCKLAVAMCKILQIESCRQPVVCVRTTILNYVVQMYYYTCVCTSVNVQV